MTDYRDDQMNNSNIFIAQFFAHVPIAAIHVPPLLTVNDWLPRRHCTRLLWWARSSGSGLRGGGVIWGGSGAGTGEDLADLCIN